jgi:hypothetical protein
MIVGRNNRHPTSTAYNLASLVCHPHMMAPQHDSSADLQWWVVRNRNCTHWKYFDHHSQFPYYWAIRSLTCRYIVILGWSTVPRDHLATIVPRRTRATLRRQSSISLAAVTATPSAAAALQPSLRNQVSTIKNWRCPKSHKVQTMECSSAEFIFWFFHLFGRLRPFFRLTVGGVSPRSGFFRKKIRIFRKILFFEFFEKWPPKNSKNSKKNNLIFDTICLQFG